MPYIHTHKIKRGPRLADGVAPGGHLPTPTLQSFSERCVFSHLRWLFRLSPDTTLLKYIMNDCVILSREKTVTRDAAAFCFFIIFLFVAVCWSLHFSYLLFLNLNFFMYRHIFNVFLRSFGFKTSFFCIALCVQLYNINSNMASI